MTFEGRLLLCAGQLTIQVNIWDHKMLIFIWDTLKYTYMLNILWVPQSVKQDKRWPETEYMEKIPRMHALQTLQHTCMKLKLIIVFQNIYTIGT